MASRSTVLKTKASARMAYIWARCSINSQLMVNVSNSESTRPYGYPARVPYATTGFWLGEVEGSVRTRTGYKDEFDTVDLSLNAEARHFVGQQSLIEARLLWSGDPKVEELLAEPGPYNSWDSFGGGSPNPKECTLLIIYVDRLKPLYGYDSNFPQIIEYKLYWKVSINPIDSENDGVPEKFSFSCVPLKSTDPRDGTCFPPGKELFHRYKLNLAGEKVNGSGVVIDPTVQPDLTPAYYGFYTPSIY